ncbi:uncharacterized protein LOC126816811 [Patella vulgata]|uniref:uncharacterized protein LOC126816811 n=1 Tax=Patella vulgata TaxID=6465 RepID=UPI00217F9800|nr:uncharacterized protein LOC126816811 [Patella vulgata]
MNGVRVSNIPIQLSEKLLRTYFSDPSHGGGEIKRIYYPLINNDAVIIFNREITAVTAVTKKHEDRSHTFCLTPLPHEVFSSVDVHLEPGLSTFVLTTDDYIKTLQDWGLRVGTGVKGHEIVTLSGSWYKIEWAWNYLSQIMEKQHAIHHRLQEQISQDDSDISELSDRDGSPQEGNLTNGAARASELRASVSTSQTKRKEAQQNERLNRGDRRDRDERQHRDEGEVSSQRRERTVRGAPHGRGYETDPGRYRQSDDESDLDMRSDHRRSSRNSDLAQLHGTALIKEIDERKNAGFSMTSSVDEEMLQRSLSRNSRARDADTTFNHFTSLQSTAGGLREPTRESDHQRENSLEQGHGDSLLARAESGRSSIHDSQETYRVSPESDENLHRSHQRTASVHRSHDEGEDADISDAETLQDRHSVASGHSETPRNSMRDSRLAQPSTSTAAVDQRYTYSSNTRRAGSRYGASAPYAEEDEVPDGYRSQSYKIGDLNIKVYLADITKATAEAIVNAANPELKNWSGVARSISKAAGEMMERECIEYITNHGRLETCSVMHTSSGGQLKQFNYILHTVGPIYIGDNYKADCFFQLTKTFLNCLIYADKKLFLKSLALPFISTGLFSIPLEDCVGAFIDAVLIFLTKTKPNSLKEVHLVNNDINIVSMASTLLQSILDSSEIDKMTAEAVSKFELKDSKGDIFNRGLTATGAAGARPKDGSSLRRCNSMDMLHNQPSDTYSGTSMTKSYDTSSDRKNVIGAAGISASTSSRQRSSSLSRRSPDKTFTRPDSPKMTSSLELAKSSRTSDPKTAQRSSTTRTYPVNDSTGATASNISQSLRKTISSASKSSRSSISPLKAMPLSTSTDSRKSKVSAASSTMNDRHLRSFDHSSHSRFSNEYQSLPANINRRTGSSNTCGICLDEMTNPKTLPKCGHKYCNDCIRHAFVNKPVCPECGMIYGVIMGNQPKGGKMIHKIIVSHKLEGFKDADGVLEITYSFHDGIQDESHPNPGRPYEGIRRRAYLPNNKDGQDVLQLLYKAFDARLIFTIGDSCTTGKSGVITWNDIHHKTSMTGGSTNHGYPDPTYLHRVKEELASKGITK